MTRRVAEERGWLGTRVRFESWRPYDRRFELALAADLAVVTHRPGLETDLSLRTRMVDLLWLGLPVVATRGGAMSRIVEAVGAGRTVAPGDSTELSAAVCALLADPGARERAGEAGRRWARGRSWDEVAKPLLDFAAAPRRDPHRDRFVDLAPTTGSAEEPLIRRAGRTLRRWAGR
jgi:glycosyltransferase involved in cell wall biosynthesis